MAIAVLPLDHGGPQVALAGVIRGVEPSGKDAKDRSWLRARHVRLWMSRARSQVAGVARMASSECSSLRGLAFTVEALKW